MSVYDFSAKTNSGEEKSLRDYAGKVLVIVNTASKCGFTPQYKELQELYDKYQRAATGMDITCLPSTSPANAAWSFERLFAEWKKIRP